jgi:hypothetical protein
VCIDLFARNESREEFVLFTTRFLFRHAQVPLMAMTSPTTLYGFSKDTASAVTRRGVFLPAHLVVWAKFAFEVVLAERDPGECGSRTYDSLGFGD